MKAQVLRSPGVLELDDVPVPAMGEDQVLVKVISACICNGSDPSIMDGAHWTEFPIIFGHEAYGRIIACGAKVEGYAAGELVSWWFTVGAFAEYASVTPGEVAMVKLPQGVSREEGPIFELVGASIRAVDAAGLCHGGECGQHGDCRGGGGDGHRRSGKVALIIGLGSSGLIMCQLLKYYGVETVLGWDLHPNRRALGLQLGCDAVFDNRLETVVADTCRIAGLADVVIDAFPDDALPGRPTLTHGLQALKDGGMMISYGHPREGRMMDTYLLQKKQAILKGPVNELGRIRQLLNEAVQIYAAGRLDLKSLVSGHLSLEQVQDGLQLVIAHPERYIKMIVDIEQEG